MIAIIFNTLSPFLNNGVTLAILSQSGKMYFSISRLKIYFRGSKTDDEICFIT